MGKRVNAVLTINAIKWGFSALNPSGVENGQIGQAAQNAPDELIVNRVSHDDSVNTLKMH